MERKYPNPKTVHGYIRDIETFTSFIEQEGVGIAKIRETHIKKFNLHLVELGYSNHTIARKNSSLRLYMKYLRKQGVMVENPMEDIKQPKMTKRNSGLDDIDIDLMEQKTKHPRDQLLLSLAYYDKIKLSFIIKLRKDQYDQQQGILYVGKTAVLLHEKTKRALNAMPACNSDFLIVNQHQKPLSESGAYYIVKTYFEEIGKPSLRPIDLYKKNTE